MALEEEYLNQSAANSPGPELLQRPCSTSSSVNNSDDDSNCSKNDSESPKYIRFSIDQILQPDFGKQALVTKVQKPAVLYRPYDLSTSGIKKLSSLGSLCQTVSQIGRSQPPPRRTCSPPRSVGSSSDSKFLSNASQNSMCRDSVSPAKSTISTTSNDSVGSTASSSATSLDPKTPTLWPAWIYCTRYSDRPSSGRSEYFFDFFFCRVGF